MVGQAVTPHDYSVEMSPVNRNQEQLSEKTTEGNDSELAWKTYLPKCKPFLSSKKIVSVILIALFGVGLGFLWYHWETDCAQYLDNAKRHMAVDQPAAAYREYLWVYNVLLPYSCKWKVDGRLVRKARLNYDRGKFDIAAQEFQEAFQGIRVVKWVALVLGVLLIGFVVWYCWKIRSSRRLSKVL